MSTPTEWPRSRYWLCHFLHSRHVRRRLDWRTLPDRIDTPDDRATADYLARLADRGAQDRSWMIDSLLERGGDDPAFVQCVRLLLKERAYHAQLLARCGQHLSPARRQPPTAGPRLHRPSPMDRLARRLGPRFEFARLLLEDLRLLTVLPSILHRPDPADRPVLHAALEQVLADRRDHADFLAERLTREFADFNFLRRNLRRYRLRFQYAACLTADLALHARLFDTLHAQPPGYVPRAWRSFSSTLEQIVPYHRDRLLLLLLTQEREPYAQPVRRV